MNKRCQSLSFSECLKTFCLCLLVLRRKQSKHKKMGKTLKKSKNIAVMVMVGRPVRHPPGNSRPENTKGTKVLPCYRNYPKNDW